jgi:hypothetical protein
MFLSMRAQGAVARRRGGQRQGVGAICECQVDYTTCV